MKALSLHPMYAAEIAVGDKPEEYRTWQTPYRGDLLICASVYNDGCSLFSDSSREAALFVSWFRYSQKEAVKPLPPVNESL